MNLEDILRQRFGPVARSRGRNGLELIVRCPVCGKRKLSINANTGMYQCWHGCYSGHIDTLLGDVAKTLSKAPPAQQAPAPRGFDNPGVLVPLTELDPDHQAIQYLVGRGFDPAELERLYGVRYCRSGKGYARNLFNTTNTIILPVYCDGALIGWQSRLLYDPKKVQDDRVREALGWSKDEDGKWREPPKYFTMPGMPKGSILYNKDWASRGNLVVVTEGAFDCWAVGRCAVATFGKGVSDTQMTLCGTYWDLTVLLLDPDALDKARELAAGHRDCVVMALNGHHDAGETPRLEIWRQIDQTLRQNGLDLAQYNFIV